MLPPVRHVKTTCSLSESGEVCQRIPVPCSVSLGISFLVRPPRPGLRCPAFDEPDDPSNVPDRVGDPRLYRWRDAQRLVNPAEVVPDEIERQHRNVALDALREHVGEPRETAHQHPHREVVPLDLGPAHVPRIGPAVDRVRDRAKTFRGAVSALVLRIRTVDFHELAVIHVCAELILDRILIRSQPIGRELHMFSVELHGY